MKSTQKLNSSIMHHQSFQPWLDGDFWRSIISTMLAQQKYSSLYPLLLYHQYYFGCLRKFTQTPKYDGIWAQIPLSANTPHIVYILCSLKELLRKSLLVWLCDYTIIYDGSYISDILFLLWSSRLFASFIYISVRYCTK